jgi:hypothetical protein
MIFLHDVSRPFGRRDMYYQPELIPERHRHAYERKTVIADKTEVIVYNATHEGGERNGVLTAIEDFMTEHEGDYYFWRVRRKNGMGILQYRHLSLGDVLSFMALVGKAVRYDSHAVLNRLARSLLLQKAIARDKRASSS